MKTKIIIFFALFLLVFSSGSTHEIIANSNSNSEDSLRVYSTPDLYDLTSNWVREYSSINPQTKIKVNIITDTPITSIIGTKGNLCFISNEYYSLISKEAIWKMVVGMDAIVPIISSKNPFLAEINQQGIAPEKIAQFLNNPEKQNWESLVENGQNNPINFYIDKKESNKVEVAKFLKLDGIKNIGVNVETRNEMISSIQNDPYAIGFCKVASLLDAKNQNIIQGIKFLPIDKNSNGKLDYNEKIYEDLSAFLRGVWIGKYPKELCGNIYSVSSSKPSGESEVEFLAWVLTNGQQYLNPNGFSDLAYSQKQTNIDRLTSQVVVLRTSNNRYVFPIAILILVSLIVLFFAVDYFVMVWRNRKIADVKSDSNTSPFFDEQSVVVPDGLYFDKSHTWAFMEKGGVVGIGIDDFLQHITGPITRIKMKNPGDKIKKGELFLSIIQNGKQLNIKAPISGTIKEQNKKLIDNASIINSSPYSEGWVYMIEPTNWLRETQFLIMAENYKEWLKKEFLRLKDFLAVDLKVNNADYVQVILQDGGEIKNGVLKDLKPEMWEDFQTNFLDNSK